MTVRCADHVAALLRVVKRNDEADAVMLKFRGAITAPLEPMSERPEDEATAEADAPAAAPAEAPAAVAAPATAEAPETPSAASAAVDISDAAAPAADEEDVEVLS